VFRRARPRRFGSIARVKFFVTLWHEALGAHTPWLLALALLALASVRDRTHRQRHFRAQAFFIAVHLVALTLAAALHSSEANGHHEFRTVAWVFGAVGFVGAGASVLFHGVFARVRVALPPILEDVMVGLLSVLAAVTAASRAEMNLSGLIATSAVFTAILGFSLQDVIGNVASGLALQVDTALEVGDWIKVNEVTGRIVEVRWRYTAIETRNWETVLVPNLVLLRNQVTVLGRRGGHPQQWRRWVHFNVDWRHPPSDVIEVVQAAVRGAEIDRVAATPPPNCVLLDMADSYGKYALRYWLTDLAADDPTDSEVRTRVYFALQRAGIKLAIPSQAVAVTQESGDTPIVKTERQAERRKGVLKSVGFFKSLADDELDELARTLRYAPFARGEVITRQGAEAHWLYLIEEGTASVRIAEAGVEREVAKLGPASVFGEMSLLTGARRSATVVADTDVECFRLEKASFQRVIERRPALVAGFAETLARRNAELQAAREGLDEEAMKRRQKTVERDLLDRIQSYFGRG
jgi:small-conductance mechanosensitive channel/CRP-like cAMP-binding protein